MVSLAKTRSSQRTVTNDVAVYTVTYSTIKTGHGVTRVVVLTLRTMVALNTRTPVNKNTYMVWLEKTHPRCKTTMVSLAKTRSSQSTVTNYVAVYTVTYSTIKTGHGVTRVVVLTLGSMVALDTLTPVNKNTYMVWLEKTHPRCKSTTHSWSH